MDKYCRVCSRTDGFRLFALTTISQISDVRVDDMLIYCTQLEVTHEDNLPQQICSECLAALNLAFVFRKLCYRSDGVLRGIIKDNLPDPDSDSRLLSHNESQHLGNLLDAGSLSGVTIKEETLEPEAFFDSIVDASELAQDPKGNALEVVMSSTNDARMSSDSSFVCEDNDYSSYNNGNRHPNKIQPKNKARQEPQGKLRKIYKCAECEHENHNFYNFKRHQITKMHNSFTSYRGLITHCKRPFANRTLFDKTSNLETTLSKVHSSDSQSECRTVRMEFKCKLCKLTAETECEYDMHVCKLQSGTEDNKYLPYKCDFCNYASSKRSNLERHHYGNRAKCKSAVYFDETKEPNVIFRLTLKRVITNSMEIGKIQLKSGEKVFSTTYTICDYQQNIGTLRPPLKFISSVSEFETVLVLHMRGVRCCGCSMFFEDNAALGKHRTFAHPMPSVATISRRNKDGLIKQCEKCYNSFYRQDSFDYHKQLEDSDKLLCCTLCKQVLVGNTGWACHCNYKHNKTVTLDLEPYEIVTVEDKFRCCNCDFLKSSQEELNAHLAEYHEPNSESVEYECDVCFKQFSNKSRLERHLELRTAKKFYRCNNRKCQMEFRVETEAMDHTCEVHQPSTNKLTLKMHCCFINCEEAFENNIDLQEHVSTVHSKQRDQNVKRQTNRNNVCKVCKLNFAKRIELRRHKLFKKNNQESTRYTKEDSNKGICCDQEFKSKHLLKLHVIANHSKGKFRCNVCGKKFRLREALQNHALRHADFKRFKCAHCPFKAQALGELRAHVLMHAHSCRLCGRPNKTLNDRRKHEIKCHAKYKLKTSNRNSATIFKPKDASQDLVKSHTSNERVMNNS